MKLQSRRGREEGRRGRREWDAGYSSNNVLLCNIASHTVMSDNEHPNADVSAPVLTRRSETKTTRSASNQRNPGYEMVDFLVSEILGLEEQFNVVYMPTHSHQHKHSPGNT